MPDAGTEPGLMSWLGRGLDDVAGKPFGWAWHMERDEIRQHLRRRIWKFGLDGKASMRLEARVDAIQRRLHRNRPTFKERQQAWYARQPKPVDNNFTTEELQHLVDMFASANHPVSASIAAKAAARLNPVGA